MKPSVDRHSQNNTAQSKINQELIDIAYKQLIYLTSGLLTAAALMGFISVFIEALPWVSVWFIANLLGPISFSFFIYWRYHAQSSTHQSRSQPMRRSISQWRHLFQLSCVLHGLSWAALIIILMQYPLGFHSLLLALIFVGVITASQPFIFPVRFAYPLFMYPIPAALAIFFLQQGSYFGLLTLGLIIYVTLITFSAIFLRDKLVQSIGLRLKNESLIKHLTKNEKKLKQFTRKLQRSLALLKATMNATSEAILSVNKNGIMTHCNKQFLKMWRLAEDDVKSHPYIDWANAVKHQFSNPESFLDMCENFKLSEPRTTYDEFRLSDGRVIECFFRPQYVNKVWSGHVVSIRDITLWKTMEQKLLKQATEDAITELPNRALLDERIKKSIHHVQQTGLPFAVCYIDLNNFKVVNDELGRQKGDTLLKQIAERLKQHIRGQDTLARIGGDEFVILLHSINNERAAAGIIEQVLEVLRAPFYEHSKAYYITASAGIAIYPHHGETPEELIKNADAAMYYAKENSENAYEFYAAGIGDTLHKRLQIESDLYQAFSTDQFKLYCQPMFRLFPERITGMEVLIYWQRDNGELVDPGKFLAFAEHSHFIIKLGKWALHTVYQQFKQTWEQKNQPFRLRIGFHLAPKQLNDPAFIQFVQKLIHESHIEPGTLEFLINEDTYMAEVTHNNAVCESLRQLGCTTTMAHFGIGHSSLYALKKLAIDRIKIDGSFIQDIDHNSNAQTIVHSIIKLGHSINIAVAAEGIRTKAAHEFLRAHDCDEGQGVYWSGPIEIGKLDKLFEHYPSIIDRDDSDD